MPSETRRPAIYQKCHHGGYLGAVKIKWVSSSFLPHPGGGVTSEFAKWIIKGKPDADMYGMDIRRFTTKLTSNQRWLKERGHESYAKTYSIVFPHDEPLAARGLRKDALYDVSTCSGRDLLSCS